MIGLPLRLAVALALSTLAVLVVTPGAQASPSAGDESRQVLVMLRLPPPHVRPNSDYGGGYGGGLDAAARWRVAQRVARQNDLTIVDDWPMPLVGVDCFVLAVPAGRTLDDVAARLAHDPAVAWAQTMNLYHAHGAPRAGPAPQARPAPRAGPAATPARLYLAQPAAREWRLALLHRVSVGRGVRIAIVDSQIDASHPDLAGQVAISVNFVTGASTAPEQHGTAVAGVVAARGIGVAGIAPGAKLLALRACWQELRAGGAQTECDSLTLAKALTYAIEHSAQVINLSLGGPADPLLGKLLDVARDRRVVVVAAFDPGLPAGGFPASHPGVIPVADETAGPTPAGVYRAPGSDVPTTAPGGGWTLVTGSSFAAAHVSGLVALMRQRAPATPLKLASRPRGGAIDACASLMGSTRSCQEVAEPAREALAAGRR
jgi:hypothetical protein